MAISMVDLQKDMRQCELTVDGETAQIEYKPSRYTPVVENALQEALEASRPSRGVAKLLAGLLVRWEVLDEDGEEMATDEETISQLPSRFLYQVMTAIQADMAAENDDRKNSGAGSPQAVSKGRRRNGTQSSERRATLG